MPLWNKVEADSTENFIIEINQRLSWILSKLDSKNVKRLNTNITNIFSANGETIIDGPLIIMKDGEGTTRLRMGYNPETDEFEFTLYNASGTATITIDSNGDIVINNDGEILITKSDNTVRCKINPTDGFKLQTSTNNGVTWVDSVYFDTNGLRIDNGIIVGGTIKTANSGARIQLGSGNVLAGYNASDQLHGIYLDPSSFVDLFLYKNGSEFFQIHDGVTQVEIKIQSDPILVYNQNDNEVSTSQDWDFGASNVTYPIYQCTQAEFDAKTDAKEGQYFDITDRTLPLLATLASTDVDTDQKRADALNTIKDILKSYNMVRDS